MPIAQPARIERVVSSGRRLAVTVAAAVTAVAAVKSVMAAATLRQGESPSQEERRNTITLGIRP
jgi:hypothetical protein